MGLYLLVEKRVRGQRLGNVGTKRRRKYTKQRKKEADGPKGLRPTARTLGLRFFFKHSA